MFNQGPFNLERGHWERRQMLDFKSNLIAKIVKSWSRLLHYSNRNSLPKFWALTHCSGSFSDIFPKQYFNGVKGSSILLSMNSKGTSIFQRYSIPCLVINFPKIFSLHLLLTFFYNSSFKFISFNILSTFSDLFKDSIRKYISYYIVMTNKKECFPISKFSP